MTALAKSAICGGTNASHRFCQMYNLIFNSICPWKPKMLSLSCSKTSAKWGSWITLKNAFGELTHTQTIASSHPIQFFPFTICLFLIKNFVADNGPSILNVRVTFQKPQNISFARQSTTISIFYPVCEVLLHNGCVGLWPSGETSQWFLTRMMLLHNRWSRHIYQRPTAEILLLLLL